MRLFMHFINSLFVNHISFIIRGGTQHKIHLNFSTLKYKDKISGR